MRNIQDKTNSLTTLDAEDFNALKNELQQFVTSTGIALDPEGGPNSSLLMFRQAVSNYVSAADFYSDSGDSDNYILSRPDVNFPAPTAYFTGMKVSFFAKSRCNFQPNINVAGLGSKSLRKRVNGLDLLLQPEDILRDQFVTATYNGITFEVDSVSGEPAGVYGKTEANFNFDTSIYDFNNYPTLAEPQDPTVYRLDWYTTQRAEGAETRDYVEDMGTLIVCPWHKCVDGPTTTIGMSITNLGSLGTASIDTLGANEQGMVFDSSGIAVPAAAQASTAQLTFRPYLFANPERSIAVRMEENLPSRDFYFYIQRMGRK